MPATSRAVARNVVVLLAGTVTGKPDEANVAAVPVAAGVPEQSPVVNSETVLDGSALPFTDGVRLWLGEVGVVPVSCGRAGATLSWT